MALSTYMCAPDKLKDESNNLNKTTPVLIAHGSQDPVIPCGVGERSAQRLQAAGLNLQWQRYPMQHAVCMEEIQDLTRWIEARMLG